MSRVAHKPTRTLADCHREQMSAPTEREVRYAGRILRKLADCKEPSGELRPLYLRVAALMNDEADYIAQVGTDGVVYGGWRRRKVPA